MTSSLDPRTDLRAADDPDALAMADRLRLSATRLARRLRQESGTDLTPSQLSALAAINAHGPLTLGALAEVERVAPPSVTKVLSKLEAAGLVARQADERDRRVVRVVTTAAGDQLLADVRERKDAWLAARVAEMTAEERRRVADALDVLER